MNGSCRTAAAAVLLVLAAAGLHAEITPRDSIYFLMTDRFFDADRSNNFTVRKNDVSAYQGGDFEGVTRKIPYIRSLGFSAIWISPVVDNQSGGYHGYWARDFEAVEEHFGTIETLSRLVDEAHAAGLKVIVDLVVNHSGIQHPFVSDPAYRDWFHPRIALSNFNDPAAVENHWLANLPDFNTENPETRTYLIDTAIGWIDLLGHDGYRLDTVRHVPKEFWEEFSSAIKAKYPEFYLVGEVFDGDITRVGSYQHAGLDGLLDFPVYFALRTMVRDGGGAAGLARAITDARGYRDRAAMATFIDNHDVPRFVNQVRTHLDERLSQALLFLFTYTGVPVLYYGTEVPIDGSSEHSGRMYMPWEHEARFAGLVTTLTTLRREHPALTDGEIDLVYRDEDTVAFMRYTEDEALVTVLYTGETEKTVKIALPETLDHAGSGIELLGPSWLGAGTGAVVSSSPQAPAAEGAAAGISAEARERTVISAERYAGEGAADTAALISEARRLPVRDRTLTVKLEPMTGSLLLLSREPAGNPFLIIAAGAAAALLAAAAAVIVIRRRNRTA